MPCIDHKSQSPTSNIASIWNSRVHLEHFKSFEDDNWGLFFCSIFFHSDVLCPLSSLKLITLTAFSIICRYLVKSNHFRFHYCFYHYVNLHPWWWLASVELPIISWQYTKVNLVVCLFELIFHMLIFSWLTAQCFSSYFMSLLVMFSVSLHWLHVVFSNIIVSTAFIKFQFNFIRSFCHVQALPRDQHVPLVKSNALCNALTSLGPLDIVTSLTAPRNRPTRSSPDRIQIWSVWKIWSSESDGKICRSTYSTATTVPMLSINFIYDNIDPSFEYHRR